MTTTALDGSTTVDATNRRVPSGKKPFKRLLMTGAAGGLGQVLRPHLHAWTDALRLSDLADCGPARDGEEIVQADLADKKAVHDLLEGVDTVLHFGGISLEAPFEDLVQANILGLYHLYAAVQKHGVRRVIYASSSHVVGFYPQTENIGIDVPLRPDSLYGVSKCFGEALSRYYFDRFGIETVCLRIGSSFTEPRNPRMMVSLLSHGDLVELVRCALLTGRVGHSIIYGVSDNPVKWWDNTRAGHLGFHASDSTRKFADQFPDQGPPDDPANPVHLYQGGPWVLAGPIEKES